MFDTRKKVHRTKYEGPASRILHARDLDPVGKAGANIGTIPDCPSADGSENMSVTNSEVESAMDHRCPRAALRTPGFTKEAFNAFSSANACIRAARDGLTRAADQHLKDMRVSLYYTNLIIIYQ